MGSPNLMVREERSIPYGTLCTDVVNTEAEPDLLPRPGTARAGRSLDSVRPEAPGRGHPWPLLVLSACTPVCRGTEVGEAWIGDRDAGAARAPAAHLHDHAGRRCCCAGVAPA